MHANQPSPFDLPMLRSIAAGKVTRDDCDGTRIGYFALYVLDGEPVGRNVLTWLHRKGLINTPMLGPPTLTEDGAAYLSQKCRDDMSSDARVKAFQDAWNATPKGKPGDRTRAGIAALDTHDEWYRPSVCAICLRKFDTPNLRHRASGDESGDVCLWPCNHEVQDSESRCLACVPLTVAEMTASPW